MMIMSPQKPGGAADGGKASASFTINVQVDTRTDVLYNGIVVELEDLFARDGEISARCPDRYIINREAGVLFARRESTRLVLNVADELYAQLTKTATSRGQSGEALAAELLARGLEQERQRHFAEAALQALTPREREVVWLALRGQTNRQIAETLVISPETVKTHVRHALQKFGQHSKADLRLLLLELGLHPSSRSSTQ